MYCTRCGKLLPDNAAFCPHCGASVSDTNRHPDGPVMTQSKVIVRSGAARPSMKSSLLGLKNQDAVLAIGLVILLVMGIFAPFVSVPFIQSFTKSDYTMLGMASASSQLGYALSSYSSESTQSLQGAIAMAVFFWVIVMAVMGVGLYQIIAKKGSMTKLPVGSVITGTVGAMLWCLIIAAINSSIVSEIGSEYSFGSSYLSSLTILAPGWGAVLSMILGAATLAIYYAVRKQGKPS